jgi:tartrate-resistant acid phosphatase type 5
MVSAKVALITLTTLQVAWCMRRAKSNSNTTAGCLTFFAIGDYGKKGDTQSAVRDGMASKASSMNPEAIFALGDNVYENGASSESHMVSDWANIYMKRSSLKRPWYAVTGNHDWRTNAKTQVSFTKSSKNPGGSWQMPAFWYKKSFSTSGGVKVDVFFIDTEIWRGSVSSMKGKISEQRNWLSSGLAGSSADWKIVCGHHPTYSAGTHGSTSTMKRELDPMMRKYGANILFAGHDHYQGFIQWKGLHYVVTGGGAKLPRGSSKGYPSGSLKHKMGPGFASLKICDKEKATLILHDKKGNADLTTTLANSDPDKDGGSGSSSSSSSSGGDGRRRARRRSRRSKKRSLEDGDDDIFNEDVDDDNVECMGKKLDGVDLVCSDDRCTVLPNTDHTCEEYCVSQGLQCAAAWQNEYEDCGKDEIITCQTKVIGYHSQMCQCTS